MESDFVFQVKESNSNGTCCVSDNTLSTPMSQICFIESCLLDDTAFSAAVNSRIVPLSHRSSRTFSERLSSCQRELLRWDCEQLLLESRVRRRRSSMVIVGRGQLQADIFLLSFDICTSVETEKGREKHRKIQIQRGMPPHIREKDDVARV